MLTGSPSSATTRLLRFPDIHDDRVVFTHAGDLWQVPATGGTATRLTSHPGLELFAKYSPDGAWIAFTGQYDGDEQVYVIPAGGGTPHKLTFYPARGPLADRWGYDNQVYGWTPDGERVLYRSLRDSFDIGESRLYTVPRVGGLPVALPMKVAGAGDLSPDGRQVLYSPLFRDFRTWKRYQGGWAQDLYIFDLETPRVERITSHPRADRDPMWIGNAVFFASDRDGKLNLYRYDLSSRKTEQLTHFADWDVRWPSSDGAGRIVYEQNGQLQIFDIEARESRVIPIFVPDDGVAKRPQRIQAKSNVEGFGLSPRGERAVIVARGEVLTVPLEYGLTRNLTSSPGAHDRDAAWSTDGKKIAYISDQTGEEQIWIADQTGKTEPVQLTREHRARLHLPLWSPDGQRIAYGDKNGRVFVVTVPGGEVTQIADDILWPANDYVWSPDSAYLAFTLHAQSGNGSLYIWSLRERRLHRVTEELFDEFTPAWDPGGEYLFYLSRRAFRPHVGTEDWNYVVDRDTGIFALALREGAAHPFPPKNDESGDRQAEEEKEREKKADKQPAAKTVKIDWDGLAQRVARVPVEADNIRGLAITETHVVFGRATPFIYEAEFKPESVVVALSRKDEKVSEVASGARSWVLSHDGKSLLVRHDKEFKVYAIGGDDKASTEPKTLSLDGLTVDRVPAREWAVIFDEVWRRFRDYFYVENMHGYDWQALREQYRPLLAHVAHRSDLNYVLGEMIAELSVSHAYISGGDLGLPDRPNVSLPGVRFELDAACGRYRVARVLAGHNAEKTYRSPLTEVGSEVRVGEYVLAINGQKLSATQNPYELLQLPPEKPVELLVNRRPTADGARTVLFEALKSETDLLYLEWVMANRRKVAEASGGRIGYLHLPDMGSAGLREFIKWFYGQVRKEGLIVDVRGNGGGNVSQMLIERLRRTLLGVEFARNVDFTMTYPYVVFTGPMVTLINETSASDGDIFPAAFRNAGLGPLIGKRTWGGIIGIDDHGPLVDGGVVYVPEFGNASAAGQWVIEGYGVEPDIEVDNDPVAVIEGKDPQLERGIAEILKKIDAKPTRLPERPPAPVKTPDGRAP